MSFSCLRLLAFADVVVVSSHTVEKLYRKLSMYEALADVQLDIEALFSNDAAASEFLVVEQLGSTVRYTIEELATPSTAHVVPPQDQ